jgi:hypothetical protein
VCAALLILLLAAPVPAATTQLKVVRYAEDESTILNETTVNYSWMRGHLPVQGDGTTHYYHQGPVFVDDPDEGREQELRWNPEEDTNVLEKDMGAVKGTDLRDLCDLAGGITEGEWVRIKASDGFSKDFAYRNIYNPSSNQGKMVITWYVDGLADYPARSYPDTGYTDGMRLVFFADTSTNPWGEHAFGNYDWHESADSEYWYYYWSGSEKYPTTTGLSIKYVSEIDLITDDIAAGEIQVTSSPGGAAILVDDADTDQKTNTTIEGLDVGPHIVTVALDGYREAAEQEVDVQWGVPAMVNFNLVRMEGSIKVTSTPPGAKVYLDGTDTGNVTPVTLPGVTPGDHTMMAKLSGYIDAFDTVTVEDGETAELDLAMEEAESGGNTGTSGEGSGTSGGTLTTRVQGVVHGGVIFANTTGPAQVLEKGASETRTLMAPIPINATATVARLYIYTDQELNERGMVGDGPIVKIQGREAAPVITYQDCRPGETPCARIETRAWDLLAQGNVKQEIPITLNHPGGQAGEITWYGAALVIVYEREGDPETRYWISEGADGVLADQDLGLAEAESFTTAEFPGELNRSLAQGARLLAVSTLPPGDTGEGHQIAFNDNEWTGSLAGDGIQSATLDVQPYLKSGGNRALLESSAESRRGELLENRNAVLVVEYGESPPEAEPVGGETPVPAGGNEMTWGTPAAVVLVTPVIPVQSVTGGTPPTSAANGTMHAGGEMPDSILGSLFRFIVSFFTGSSGGAHSPAEEGPPPQVSMAVPTTPPPTPTPSVGEEVRPADTAASHNLTVTSSPGRALVFLDGEYMGKVTPVTLTGVPSGPHTLRLEMEVFRPGEQMVDLEEDMAIHVNLTSPYPEYTKLLQGYDDGSNGSPDHCGGVYVESYPEGGRILVDGKDTGLVTSSGVYGLKEGLHTIRVRLENAGFSVDRKKVWVYPGTISRLYFDVAPLIRREVMVESEEFRKAEFTVNGRYPVFRIPRKVTFDSWDSYVTVRKNGTYFSYPADRVDANGTLFLERGTLPLTTLLIRSNPPGADILVDGFPTGLTTPWPVRNLSAGRHRIEVSAPGYIPQEREIFLLDLPGGGPDAVMEFSLESYTYGSLEITSTPPGARIFLYQRDTGEKTPHVFPYLGIGSYDAKVVSSSDSRTLYDLTVTPYRTTSAHVNLSDF